MPLGHKEVSDIIKLIDASELEEFVVEVGDIKIEVRRKAMRDQSAVGGAPLGRATVETEAPTSFTVRSDRTVALDGDPVHDTALPLVVVQRAVLGTAVVPECQRSLCPAIPARELGPR